ncbi:hypothetical protein LMG29739_06341 [Paraburkholderia solisilvae]|uniref:Uncharacterized protein n=1 Tax=Paraburkholderia solisilvae TaxID=624376 RepID=A0A6J5F5W2_9BURK|nr:hypothetical protein LMG29739_06341 [Paraburkholderia solisilvae]
MHLRSRRPVEPADRPFQLMRRTKRDAAVREPDKRAAAFDDDFLLRLHQHRAVHARHRHIPVRGKRQQVALRVDLHRPPRRKNPDAHLLREQRQPLRRRHRDMLHRIDAEARRGGHTHIPARRHHHALRRRDADAARRGQRNHRPLQAIQFLLQPAVLRLQVGHLRLRRPGGIGKRLHARLHRFELLHRRVQVALRAARLRLRVRRNQHAAARAQMPLQIGAQLEPLAARMPVAVHRMAQVELRPAVLRRHLDMLFPRPVIEFDGIVRARADRIARAPRMARDDRVGVLRRMQHLADIRQIRIAPHEGHRHHRPVDQPEVKPRLSRTGERLRQPHRAAVEPRRARVAIEMQVDDVAALFIQIRITPVPVRAAGRRDAPGHHAVHARPRVFEQRQPVQPVRRDRREPDPIAAAARRAARHPHRQQPVLRVGQLAIRQLQHAARREIGHVAAAAVFDLRGVRRLAAQPRLVVRVVGMPVRRAPDIRFARGGAVVPDLVRAVDRLIRCALGAEGAHRVARRDGRRVHLERIDRFDASAFQPAGLAVCDRQRRVAAVVRQVVAEAHLLAAPARLAHVPDARAAAQPRDEREVVLVPLHHELALAVSAIQVEVERREQPVEAVLAQDLRDDLRVAHVEEEAALRRVAQQRHARLQHDLVGGFVHTAAEQRKAGRDTAHAPLGLGRAPRRVRRLDDEARRLVQVFVARQVVPRVREADHVTRRLADRAFTVKREHPGLCRTAGLRYVEAIVLMGAGARTRQRVGRGRCFTHGSSLRSVQRRRCARVGDHGKPVPARAGRSPQARYRLTG